MLNENSKIMDEELEEVNGGIRRVAKASNTASGQMMAIACGKCKKTINADLSKSVAICPFCGFENLMMG